MPVMTRPVPAARVRPGVTVLRDGQRWTVTAVATSEDHWYIPAGQIDVDAECIDGNVGELAYWTLRADEPLRVVRHPLGGGGGAYVGTVISPRTRPGRTPRMTAWHVLSTTLAGRWRALLLLVAGCVAFAVVAVAQAAPTLTLSAARARSRVAAYHWCMRHDWYTPIDFYVGEVSICRGHHLVGSCVRAHIWKRERLYVNPRRTNCRVAISWDHEPFVWAGGGKPWTHWYCEDTVSVWVTTKKPYLIREHFVGRRHCKATLYTGWSARRVPVAR